MPGNGPPSSYSPPTIHPSPAGMLMAGGTGAAQRTKAEPTPTVTECVAVSARPATSTATRNSHGPVRVRGPTCQRRTNRPPLAGHARATVTHG